MTQQEFSDDFKAILDVAHRLADHNEADAVLVMLEGPTDWQQLLASVTNHKLLVSADSDDFLQGAAAAGIPSVLVNMPQAPVFEKLTQTLLESVADEILLPGADVVAVYSGFEADRYDSVSMIHLDEHLSRLTVRDIRMIETRVPLETLKTVVDLAVEHHQNSIRLVVIRKPMRNIKNRLEVVAKFLLRHLTDRVLSRSGAEECTTRRKDREIKGLRAS